MQSDYGGLGGNGIGSGNHGGAGGAVNDQPDSNGNTSAQASGYSAKAYARQYGGAGGAGYNGATGGAGASSRLVDAATGTTTGGSLTLKQRATGGVGGSSDTTAGGTGGNAYSHLTFTDTSAPQSQLADRQRHRGRWRRRRRHRGGGCAGRLRRRPCQRDGRDGGDGQRDCRRRCRRQRFGHRRERHCHGRRHGQCDHHHGHVPLGTAAATAFALGGGSGAAQGKADATSTASTAAGQEAMATSSANGGTDLDNEAKSTASTAGGLGGVIGVDATTDATGGGDLTAVSNAEIDTAGADLWAEPGYNGAQNSVYASVGVLAPQSGLLAGILNPAGSTPTIAAQLGGPNATIMGYGTQGGYAIAAASGLETLTSTDTFELNGPTQELIVGLVGNNSYLAGFNSLSFTVTVGGTTVEPIQTFTTLAAAQQFFTDNALDLGPADGGRPVVLTLTLVTSTAGNGFEESFLLGGAPITDVTWTGTTGTDLGTAGNWQPNTLPDASETLHFNLAAGGILTGTVAGMNAEFTGEGGWVLQGAALTVAGEADAPAISDAGNVTVNGGTIAAGGSIDIESASGASMTVLGGAQISALGVSVGADAGQSGLLMVGGAGTSIHNTGTGGSLLIGGGGSGIVTVGGGALLTDTAVDVLGAATGGGRRT